MSTNLRLIIKYLKQNDNEANRKNSCDRSYCNYRIDSIGATLIKQYIFI